MMYMLDTNICIYAIKKQPEQVLAKIKEKRELGLCISAITLSELEYGAAKSANPEKNRTAIMRLLFVLDVLPFGDKAAMEYGMIRAHLERKGTPIGPLDMLIASHAKSEGQILVTNNVKEFVRVPGLKVENWVE
ncbi:MAG: type II toxin-antitoxin system VapC family toxin [Angelakisella sp.]|nr:type II toxin-antitoxin system VapC family toxin [Angelakisella sp.]